MSDVLLRRADDALGEGRELLGRVVRDEVADSRDGSNLVAELDTECSSGEVALRRGGTSDGDDDGALVKC